MNNLVLLKDLSEDIIVDLKYSTTDNFTNTIVYPSDKCAINYETGINLLKANEKFMEHGYKIKVLDAYRPISVQKIFYDIYPDSNYVAKPPKGDETEFKPSHMNGMCVDVTLVDKNGVELEMPSAFDEFSISAKATNPNCSDEAKRNITLLVQIMESCGFHNYEFEWWHYNDVVNVTRPYSDVLPENL